MSGPAGVPSSASVPVCELRSADGTGVVLAAIAYEEVEAQAGQPDWLRVATAVHGTDVVSTEIAVTPHDLDRLHERVSQARAACEPGAGRARRIRWGSADDELELVFERSRPDQTGHATALMAVELDVHLGKPYLASVRNVELPPVELERALRSIDAARRGLPAVRRPGL